MTNLEKDVLEALENHGKLKNKKIRGKLFFKYGKIEGSRIRQTIHSLREKKHPIVSDTEGYWISDNQKEIYDCVKTMKGRARKINSAAKGLESNIR